MNAQAKTINKVDWSKFTLTEWLYQFGNWQADVQGAIGFKCTQLSPLYNAIKEAKQKLKQSDSGNLLAAYFTDENYNPSFAGKDRTCLISDEEANEVQWLVVSIIRWANTNQSLAMLEFMDAIIDRYFRQLPWSQMKTAHRTEMDAKYDVKCGLAALHLWNPHIKYIKGTV